MTTPNMIDYEAERRSFQLEAPEYFNFATDVVGKWAQDPGRLAMMWLGQDGSERRISFTEFADHSNKAANAFAQLGIQKGDPVLIMLPRVPEWWESVLALMKLGAIFIPCTTLLTPQDIQHRIHVAEAKGFITDSEGAAKLDQIPASAPAYAIL